MKVARISNLQALEQIADEWSALVERTPAATPFHRPQWLIPWWRQSGSGELHALTFRSGLRLTGFLGLFIHPWDDRRQVTLMGTGITDCIGLVAEPDGAAACARATFDYLREICDLWDVCDWQDLAADSPLIAAAPADMQPAVFESLPCTRVDLPEVADVYEASLPHGLQRTIRTVKRKLEREGELRFETLREDPDSAILQQLFRLHESRWATKGGSHSMLDKPSSQLFLAEAARRLSAAGKLRLYAMRYRGELAAIVYTILDRGRAWGYITGMDPSLSRFSPGSLVLRHAIREAIEEGAQAWEFLRGDEAYKFLWGASTVPKRRLRLWCTPEMRSGLQSPGAVEHFDPRAGEMAVTF